MMKCPRCGFTQPRDQYCAQCGVDVSSYKPPARPLMDRLFQSSLVQLGLVAVIIFLVASYVMKKKDHNLTERVNYLKGNLQISSQKPTTTGSTTNPNPAPPSPETTTLKDSSSTATLAAKNAAPTSANVAPSATAPSSAVASLAKTAERSTEGASGENKAQHSVRISYYEISKRVREMLIEESRNTGQFNSYGNDYVAGLLTQFHRRLPTLGKDAVLLHSETKAVDNENFAHWFIGLESSNAENHIGFRNNLELIELDPNSFRINFEVIKSWKEPTQEGPATLTKTSYPLQIEMLKNSACFISGIITPTGNSEGEDYISSIPPFTILKSQVFRNRGSQFLILIEIEK